MQKIVGNDLNGTLGRMYDMIESKMNGGLFVCFANFYPIILMFMDS